MKGIAKLPWIIQRLGVFSKASNLAEAPNWFKSTHWKFAFIWTLISLYFILGIKNLETKKECDKGIIDS